MLRHVVLFAFKPEASAAEIDAICAHFRRLPQEIEQIASFEWGLNVSPEGIDQGLTHCFTLSFASTADRDGYLVHPAHQAFVTAGSPYFAKALVVDYWAQAVEQTVER